MSSFRNEVVEGNFLPILLLELPEKKHNNFLARNYVACRRVKLCHLNSSCLVSSILHGISTQKHDPVVACSNLKPRYIIVQEEYWYSTRNTFGEWNVSENEIVFLEDLGCQGV